MEEIQCKVINYSEIPYEIKKDSWLNDYTFESYVMVHIDIEDEPKELITKWILENYPELEDEDYFFIKIDN